MMYTHRSSTKRIPKGRGYDGVSYVDEEDTACTKQIITDFRRKITLSCHFLRQPMKQSEQTKWWFSQSFVVQPRHLHDSQSSLWQDPSHIFNWFWGTMTPHSILSHNEGSALGSTAPVPLLSASSTSFRISCEALELRSSNRGFLASGRNMVLCGKIENLLVLFLLSSSFFLSKLLAIPLCANIFYNPNFWPALGHLIDNKVFRSNLVLMLAYNEENVVENKKTSL